MRLGALPLELGVRLVVVAARVVGHLEVARVKVSALADIGGHVVDGDVAVESAVAAAAAHGLEAHAQIARRVYVRLAVAPRVALIAATCPHGAELVVAHVLQYDVERVARRTEHVVPEEEADAQSGVALTRVRQTDDASGVVGRATLGLSEQIVARRREVRVVDEWTGYVHEAVAHAVVARPVELSRGGGVVRPAAVVHLERARPRQVGVDWPNGRRMRLVRGQLAARMRPHAEVVDGDVALEAGHLGLQHYEELARLV